MGETTYSIQHLIIAADAWTNQVLSMLGQQGLNLAVTREEVAYFAPKEPSHFSADRMPVWIWMGDPSFYGFPDLVGLGVKLGQDCGGPLVSADGRGFDPDPDYQARLRSFLGELLPGAAGARLEARTCLYTMTPDHEFVIDRLPGCSQAVLGLGSGHGFKFASVIGRILVDLCLDGATSADISGFTIDRPVLTVVNPAWNLLI
jgi:sarcosine oxidase